MRRRGDGGVNRLAAEIASLSDTRFGDVMAGRETDYRGRLRRGGGGVVMRGGGGGF